MIKAVIFDMDGLLIDSEPLWKQAELDVLTVIGVPLTFEMTKETTGLRIDEVVEYWHSRYPWATPSRQEAEDQIVRRLIELVDSSGKPMAGVDEAISVINQAGLPMAIASSSSEQIIDAVLLRLDIREHMKVIHSAQHEPYGKPHPGVYISAAKKMGVKPNECLAFEDSVNGILAAKAAKMRCVAIPDLALRHDPRLGIADTVLESLNGFTAEVLRNLAKTS